MIIDLATVGKVPKMIDWTFPANEIDLETEGVALTKSGVLTGEIRRFDKRVELHGTIAADVVFDCSRCLKPVVRTLNIPFRALFVEALKDGTEVDREIVDDQLDESIVEDERIDLAEVVREQVLLATPQQVFCGEGCKGLCPKCGADLNLIECNCADDEIDPRWAALKDIK